MAVIENFVLTFWSNHTITAIGTHFLVGSKGNIKTGVTRKQSIPNFPKNKHFLSPDTHTCVCLSGGKKC